MKLNDLDNKNVAINALKENFAYDLNTSKLNKIQTRGMLSKVKGLIRESRKSSTFYQTQNNETHLKLVFMEQALSSHLDYLQSFPNPRIVLENEEVDKSQVILAAQDMVDSVQKYYEDINDMLVKELPALVDSIQSEIGVNESESYNQQVGETLTALNAALLEAKNSLQSALGGLTGQGNGFDTPESDEDLNLDVDMDVDMDTDDVDMGDIDSENELPPIPEIPDEEPESDKDLVGRAKR